MRGNAQPDGRPLGESELRSGLFFTVCAPKYTELSLPVWKCRSLQCRFLTDNVLLCSRNIHDHVMTLSEIEPNFRL